VAVYFGEQVSLASRTPTRVLPTQTPTPAPPPPPAPTPPEQSKKSNIGAIVGGTVGGVVVLVIVICGFLFCLRRRKRNRQIRAASAYPEGVTTMQSSMHGYPSDPKHSVTATPPHSPPSTVHSPSLSTHQQQAGSITHSSPYATPPPAQPEPMYHHPAHDPSPIPYYPPPSNASRVDSVPRTHSHEMPAVRSPASHEMPTVRSPEATNFI
jgi:hypothetical protein